MRNAILLSCMITAVALTGCIQTAGTNRPDHRIAVISDAQNRGKLVAVPKSCPMWEDNMGDGLENHFDNHFGCSQNYNLAKTIVEPGDLVRGREPDMADSSTGVLSIERYRTDKRKELMNPKEINATTK
jgi:hypothetical protein